MFLIRFVVRRLLVILAIAAIPLVAGELIARKLVGDAVKSAVAARFGGQPAVSFGSTPLLWQLVNGRLDDVTVTEAGADVGGLPPVSVTANFENVTVQKLIGLHGLVAAVAVTASLDRNGVRELLRASPCAGELPDGIGAALTAGPRVRLHAGAITLLPPRGRAVLVRLVPSAVDGELDLRLVRVVAHGASVAPGSLGPAGGCLVPLHDLPFRLTLASAGAMPGALRLELRGSRAEFQE